MVFIFFTCNKPPCYCDFEGRLSINCKITDNLGHDLVKGSFAIYKRDSIQILDKINNFYVNNASVNPGYPDTTLVAFNFHIPATKNYIYYGQASPGDSLEIDWITKTGKCCGGPQDYYAVGSVKFNNQIILPQNGVYYFIK